MTDFHPAHLAAVRAARAGDANGARAAFASALAALGEDGRFLMDYAGFARSVGEAALASSLYARAVALMPDDASLRLRQALATMEAGQLQPAIALLQGLTRDHPRSAMAWQALGAALRDADRTEAAGAAFDRVLAIEPADPLGRLSRAQILNDLGEPATTAFASALSAAPTSPAAILGFAAAQAASGAPAEAAATIEAALARDAEWADGWSALASLVHRREGRAASLAVMHRAMRGGRATAAVILAMLRAMMAIGAPEVASAMLPAMRRSLGAIPPLILIEAQAASETGDMARADAAFRQLSHVADPVVLLARVRHALKAGRAEEAVAIGAPTMNGPAAHFFLPYLGSAWRVLGDPRHAWLEGDPRLVGTYDLGIGDADLDALAEDLRALHNARHAPFEQSMRGGTQTEGMLLSRRSPTIRRLRGALEAAIRAHIDQLPPIDPTHPSLAPPREHFRFSGSWSVRLAGGGRHVNHVHSEGWISSACYIVLPEAMTRPDHADEAGWLVLGQPPEELALDLPPTRVIRPAVGRVVLFPSTMWHGTRPAPSGERLSVAFDVRPLS